MAWNIEYYQSGNGKCPVEEFIDSLEKKSRPELPEHWIYWKSSE
jgi:hypothetical protein